VKRGGAESSSPHLELDREGYVVLGDDGWPVLWRRTTTASPPARMINPTNPPAPMPVSLQSKLDELTGA
jgi:hypothetical protein